MTQEIDLAIKALAWIVAPTGILVACWFFAARFIALLRRLVEAVTAFCEAERTQHQRRRLGAAPRGDTPEKAAATIQRLVYLGRDADRFRAEGFEKLGDAAVELGKSTIPLAAMIGFGILLAAPWSPACSPVTYVSELLHPEPAAADTSLEFIADAGIRFQGRIAELNTALAESRAERDRLASQLGSVKASIARADLPAEQRRTLLAACDRPAESARTPPPPTTTTGAPVTSVSPSSTPPAITSATPAPPSKAARSREILKELAARWAPCVTELEALSDRGPGGAKFANWVQPRLLNLLRSESDKERDLILRELLAAFDADKSLVGASPVLTRVDQLLRQLDILLHGI